MGDSQSGYLGNKLFSGGPSVFYLTLMCVDEVMGSIRRGEREQGERKEIRLENISEKWTKLIMSHWLLKIMLRIKNDMIGHVCLHAVLFFWFWGSYSLTS